MALVSAEKAGVCILEDPDVARSCHVQFGFTEKNGGVSKPPFATLNLGTHIGDNPDDVTQNQKRALAALGIERYFKNLVVPTQTHTENILVIENDPVRTTQEIAQAAQLAAQTPTDAIVCNAPGIPAYVVTADCVPVILVTKGAFAVIHSGWKGTKAHIATKALTALLGITHATPQDIKAYIGPSIGPKDYPVNADRAQLFPPEVSHKRDDGTFELDLQAAIEKDLRDVGLPHIERATISTARATESFFSYRADGGKTGRQAAIACVLPEGEGCA